MTTTLKLGMIGLDTSHVSAFASILNNPDHPYHVPGGTIEVAYPGEPSQDFELSIGRVGKYTEELRSVYGVDIVDSAEEVAERSDAILLVSVDGRVHFELFRRIVRYGKPVFIDKPFTVDSGEAEEIVRLAAAHGVPLMSCSSLRYSAALEEQLGAEGSAIIGADCFGPMAFEAALPEYFWYGIHAAESLFRILGKGCVSVTVTSNDTHDSIVGTWNDGRIGTLRGNRAGNGKFGALVHRVDDVAYVNVGAHPKPYYAGLLERVMEMFRTGQPDIDPAESVEIVRFLECANESRRSGTTVKL